MLLKADIEYDGVADCVFDTEALAVIVAVLYIERELLGVLLDVERVVEVLEGCEDLEKDGVEVDDFVVLDDPLTVDVLNTLLVCGASLVTVGLFDSHDEYEPEKLDSGLGVALNDDVIVLVFVRTPLTVAESVADTDTVLEIRELT